jgi:hypothetical protein
VWTSLLDAADAFSPLALTIAKRQSEIAWISFATTAVDAEAMAAMAPVPGTTRLITSIVVNGAPIGCAIITTSTTTSGSGGGDWPESGASTSLPNLLVATLKRARANGALPRDASIWGHYQDHMSVHVRHQEGTMQYWIFEGPRQVFLDRFQAYGGPLECWEDWCAPERSALVRSISVHEAAALRISLLGLAEMLEEPTFSGAVVAPDLAVCARIAETPLGASHEPSARASFLQGMLSQTLSVNPLPLAGPSDGSLAGDMGAVASQMLNKRALCYAQRNLVQTMPEPFPEAHMGQNAQVVSVAVMTDRVMQDGFGVNRASLERGMFAHTHYYRESVTIGQDCPTKDTGHFHCPVRCHERVAPGAPVIVHVDGTTGAERVVRTNPHWAPATVEWIHPQGLMVLLVAVDIGGAHWLGLKITNDGGQKGVISHIYDAEDGPVCVDPPITVTDRRTGQKRRQDSPFAGMQYDVVISPFGMTRQVASVLVSMFVSTLSVHTGRLVNLPNFADASRAEEETVALLHSLGLTAGDGKHTLMNGQTGELYACRIFTGFQQQMVLYPPPESYKVSGPWCARSILTRAPLTAPRMGAQEKRVLLNHGCAAIELTRAQAGAGVDMWVCSVCGDDVQQTGAATASQGGGAGRRQFGGWSKQHGCRKEACVRAGAKAVHTTRMHTSNTMFELYRFMGLDVRVGAPAAQA